MYKCVYMYIWSARKYSHEFGLANKNPKAITGTPSTSSPAFTRRVVPHRFWDLDGDFMRLSWDFMVVRYRILYTQFTLQ